MIEFLTYLFAAAAVVLLLACAVTVMHIKRDEDSHER